MTEVKRALITGAAGQDGSYLAELLLDKGYAVFGIVRPSSTRRPEELRNISLTQGRMTIIECDITDAMQLTRIIRSVRPHEIYNLAAQSHVGFSFESPRHTADATGIGALNVLEAVRESGFCSKVYQASTSELFGNARDVVDGLDETSPFDPVSPYAASKLFAHNMVKIYRKSYNMFACTGILFNHESPRRGPNFVTQKVCRAIVDIKRGVKNHVELGNLSACRDWGHAKDYVRGMHMIMQHREPDDFVLSTGIVHSVEELVTVACKHANIPFSSETVKTSSNQMRPTDVSYLVGHAQKAKDVLGWEPKITFKELIHEMMDAYETERYGKG